MQGPTSMTHRNMFGEYPPQSSRPLSREEPHHRDPMFLLGAIFERTSILMEDTIWVRTRLEQGAYQFQKHEGRLSTVEAKVEEALRAKPSQGDDIPKWERTLKRWAAWTVPIGVGLGTGQIQSALEWAKLLK